MQILVMLAKGKGQKAKSKELRAKSMKLYARRFMLFALCPLLIFVCSCGGGPKYYTKPNFELNNIKRVAVLPFDNFTSDEYAGEKIRKPVITELILRGIDVIEPGEVTKVMRELKIK